MPQDQIIQRVGETLRNAIDNLNDKIKFKQRDFTYKIGRRVCKVAENNVLYIEHSTVQHKVHMITKNGEVEFKGNISQIDDEAPFLVKVSQSCLVNPKNIRAIDKSRQIIMFDDEHAVTYSRSGRAVVKKLMNEFENIKAV